MKIGYYIDTQRGLPASGPLRGTAGQITGLMLMQLVDPPRGRPAGGGGVHPSRGHGGLNPHHRDGIHSIFMGNLQYNSLCRIYEGGPLFLPKGEAACGGMPPCPPILIIFSQGSF
jgi:hypothetical protein